ncbi:MAG: sigma-70 family RNA polymerase sigma factor [Planctomycetota bacterium]
MDDVLSARFRARLLAFIRRRVASDADAEDLLQHVLMRFVESGPIEDAAGPSWLFTTARRAVIDWYRRRGSDAVLPEVEAAPLEEGGLSELRGCAAALLAQLPEADAELVRAVDVEGRPQTELARELGVAVSTVKSRVQRARARFRDQLVECCSLLLDARGTPIEVSVRRVGDNGCGCDSSACGCGG